MTISKAPALLALAIATFGFYSALQFFPNIQMGAIPLWMFVGIVASPLVLAVAAANALFAR